MRTLLPLLTRPSRYTGIEEGAVHKDPATVSLRVALAFPDTYEVAMSYLGQKVLYGIVNDHAQWWAERAVAPEREDGATLRAHGRPLCTLESGTPLGDMHCIGFSVTHELCYTNILYMLDLAGIPLRTADRGDSLRDWPLVISGGGALLSAEPLTPFIDLMVLGDGEETLPEVLALLEGARRDGWTRTAFLREARRIPGVYIPSFFTENADGTLSPLFPDYTRASRRIVTDINKASYPVRQVVPFGAVHNRLALEIARGCTRGCRFCHAGMVYRPVRERSLPTLEALLEQCLAQTGYDDVSFLSLSTGDFSALKTLCDATFEKCAREQVAVSLPSLRVGSIDDSIIERMAGIRRTGATLAPEAGSQRLRDVINKGVTEEALILHAQKLLEHGWQQVKLYFMIGLPTETDEDLHAILELCRKVRDAAGPGGPRLQVTAALSPFVPKPFTPFQWYGQIPLEEIQRRIRVVRTEFKGQKCLKMRWHEPAMSHLEGIFSRGGRNLAAVVEKAYRKGAIFSAWMEGFSLELWQQALAECGISAEDCIGERPLDGPLPWDHLEAGIDPAFLRRELDRALAGRTTEDCRYGACRQCGACDRKGGPSRLPHLPEDEGAPLRNILNLPARDQQAHAPRRDEEGRIICRPRSARPPQIAPELAVKAAQYRVIHTKTGGAAYFSQLEMQDLLSRAMRRATLPLAFSQGFHPLPLVSFGRALPVGVHSQAEWFAITLREPMEADEVRRRLEPYMPQGIHVVDVLPVQAGQRTVQSSREAFVLSFPGGTAGSLLDKWRAFAQATSFVWTRETKKGERSTDLRRLIRDVRVEEDRVAFAADWGEQYLSPLAICLAVCGQEALPLLRLEKIAQFFDA
ncbi:MAG: TIGR03960 family B12-binding radical SAM protein [Desulfovibrionaceae bacterium]|nr:TIGR03960 family B12-binding radical SAM protein [Desulfovibrionaceae bacterium]